MGEEAHVAVPGAADGFAATAVLIRDGSDGIEVLLAERPRDRGSFRGAWVFPGGGVDPGDAADGDPAGLEAARSAAVRETAEEVGLVLDPADLVPFSRWTPPPHAEKRLVTTFFAARAPAGEPTPAPGEVVTLRWMRPVDALDRHGAGSLTLFPPTWVTLHGLSRARTVEEALAALRAGGIRSFTARFTPDRKTILWEGDADHDAPDTATRDVSGTSVAPRHRLVMSRLPWTYLDSGAVDSGAQGSGPGRPAG